MKILNGNVKMQKWNSHMVWAGEPEYTKITRLYMSTGNGDSWYEYVKRCKITDGLMRLITYRGKNVTINAKWIVKAEDFTIIRIKGIVEILPGLYDEKVEERLYLAQDDTNVVLL